MDLTPLCFAACLSAAPSSLPPFDELADPRRLVELAVRAEERGWDGFFLWDHMTYGPPVRALADPWVAMAAIAARDRAGADRPAGDADRRGGACRSSRARRRRWTSCPAAGSCSAPGSAATRAASCRASARRRIRAQRAKLLDDGLDAARRATGTAASSRGRCSARGSRCGSRRAGRTGGRVKRAARWDGLFPIDLPGPGRARRAASPRCGRGDGFDVVVENAPGTDRAPWEAAGATWCLTGWDEQPRYDEVAEAIDSDL